MNADDLLESIKANLPDLQDAMPVGELFFVIGMDGSSLAAEVEVSRTLHSCAFRQRLRESGVDFYLYRDGKIEFVEVSHA
ncbi:hypothetical protein [Pseudomonas sp. BEA3.1]|uniref:hypothetical protein n=1 Tax=Pseudomonas sp. BEA3.1 TaxID=3083251 RepID=UPI0029644687|nr:hypothetical protein [Pseudomonas sp. BEA3.1]MDW2777437.1 hypothetical protein [Pseudomonas sp. BEA3.1]